MKPVSATAVPGFFELVDVLGRGWIVEWRRLYADALQNPELRRKLQLILEFAGAEIGEASEVWSILLEEMPPLPEAILEPTLRESPAAP